PPLTADRLPELWGPWGGPREANGAYTWGTSVFGPPPARLIPTQREREQQRVEAIATAARMPTISTFSDALTAMQRLGLLFSDDEGRLAPNPAPIPAWEALNLTPAGSHVSTLRAVC